MAEKPIKVQMEKREREKPLDSDGSTRETVEVEVSYYADGREVERESREVEYVFEQNGEEIRRPVEIVIERTHYADGLKGVKIYAPSLEAVAKGSKIGAQESATIRPGPLEASAEQPPPGGKQEG